MNQKGFTFVELLAALNIVGSIIVFVLVAWVIWHFVSKFW